MHYNSIKKKLFFAVFYKEKDLKRKNNFTIRYIIFLNISVYSVILSLEEWGDQSGTFTLRSVSKTLLFALKGTIWVFLNSM